MLRRCLPLLVLLLAVGCGGVPAAGECQRLDLRSDGGRIAATVRVAAAEDVRVVVVHEGHVAWRGVKRGPFTYTHRMQDYGGPDRVSVRTSGPRGHVCTTSGVVP
jgi:hypothetical protein